jgi:hypothetical protein
VKTENDRDKSSMYIFNPLIEKINGRSKVLFLFFNSTANWLALSPKKMKKNHQNPFLGDRACRFLFKIQF